MQVPLKTFIVSNGLIASRLAPTLDLCAPQPPVGASLLAMGSGQAPQIPGIYTLRMTVAH
jgi:hypothetical protein